METGIHLKTHSGIIYYLTASNEAVIKEEMLIRLTKYTPIEILETGEVLKLEDIFNT